MSKLVFTPQKNVLSTPRFKVSYSVGDKERWSAWFRENVSHIFRFQDAILADSRMASFMIPDLPGGAYIGCIYFSVKVMILCWQRVPVYHSGVCPKCGGASYLYTWRGIPTSGTCTAYAWCPECNELFYYHSYPFREKWHPTAEIAMQCISEEDPDIERPSVDEFISFVENLKKSQSSTNL